LRIVGDGPLRDVATAAAAERADIAFDGPTDQAGVREAMRAASVIISASTWMEVLTTVIIEALSLGRPVLGTALGGTPYLIGVDTPNPAGWTFEPTPTALAEALPVALAGAAAKASAARARYESTFSPDVVRAQLLQIYTDTLKQ
jgi:glycosyltransferase involved in cell wall biosynthesis